MRRALRRGSDMTRGLSEGRLRLGLALPLFERRLRVWVTHGLVEKLVQDVHRGCGQNEKNPEIPHNHLEGVDRLLTISEATHGRQIIGNVIRSRVRCNYFSRLSP